MPTIYPTGKRIDHYQIMRPLGQGGASHVYLAQDWHALQEVVLKFPDDSLIGGAAVFERYKREAEIGRLLSHQYIQRHLNQGERRSAEYLSSNTCVDGRCGWWWRNVRPDSPQQRRCCVC